MDRFQKFLWSLPFQQITGGARAQCLEDAVTVLKYGQHHDLRVGHDWLQLANTFNSRFACEIDIHQHHLGIIPGQAAQGCIDIIVRADESEFWQAPKVLGHTLAELRDIFDDGDSDHAMF